VEEMILYVEEMDAESNITTNNGRRWGIVYLFHRMAEGT
jgi:hypothetical protein